MIEEHLELGILRHITSILEKILVKVQLDLVMSKWRVRNM